jgi:site-specific recombinase XerD
MQRTMEIGLFLESRDLTCCETTKATYRQCLRAFGAWLGEQPIVAATIEDYLGMLKARKLSSDSRRNVYRMLKTFCRWLVDHDLLERDPFVGRGRVLPPALKRRPRRVYKET